MFSLSGSAADAPALPAWAELHAMVRSNLTTRSSGELDRALVQGLLDQLRGEVVVVGQETEPTSGPALLRADLHEVSYVYLRVARVEPGLEQQVADALDRLTASNKLEGVVLDLRFATGRDYATAAAVADRFIGREMPLLDWGDKPIRSRSQTNDLTVPVAVLANARTSGAPEALAAVLREAKVGLIIGATTAGRANVFREFSLEDGQKVRIATSKVRLGDGEVMPAAGVQPDIEVTVKTTDELVYFEDPWRALSPPATVAAATGPPRAATNSQPRRVTEADLIRQRQEELGGREPEPARARPQAAAKPILQDPVLARAIDLLKGLAIVRQGKVR